MADLTEKETNDLDAAYNEALDEILETIEDKLGKIIETAKVDDESLDEARDMLHEWLAEELAQ